MLVPVGIAYAVASGVPGIYGLYATIIPLLAYALFGPSRILVLGPDSSLAAVILSVVLPLSGGDPLRAVTLAGMHGDRFGHGVHPGRRRAAGFRDRADLQADPVRLHERNCVDGTDQPTAQAFWFLDRGATGPLRDLWAIAGAIMEGRTNWTALVLGAATLAVILFLRGSKRVPGILIAVVGATAIVGSARPRGALRRGGSGSPSAGSARIRRSRGSATLISARC